MPGISDISGRGLDGVSINNYRVCDLKDSCLAATSDPETKVESSPKRLRMVLNNCTVGLPAPPT